MAFPNFAEKHAGRPFVTPQRFLRYRSDHGVAIDRMPRAVIVSWQRRLLDRVKASRAVRETSGPAGAVLELSPTVARGSTARSCSNNVGSGSAHRWGGA